MSMSDQDKSRYKKLLADICENCSCGNAEGYCTLKEIVTAMGTSQRTLVQLKTVEVFRYMESQREGLDIGWDKAWMLWNDLGYAAKFAQIYDETPDLNYKAIYAKVVA